MVFHRRIVLSFAAVATMHDAWERKTMSVMSPLWPISLQRIVRSVVAMMAAVVSVEADPSMVLSSLSASATISDECGSCSPVSAREVWRGDVYDEDVDACGCVNAVLARGARTASDSDCSVKLQALTMPI